MESFCILERRRGYRGSSSSPRVRVQDLGQQGIPGIFVVVELRVRIIGMEIDAAAAVGVAGVCNLAETELGEREVVAGRERETRQAAGLAVARRSRTTSDATRQRPA